MLEKKKKIFVGADHGGFSFKSEIIKFLESRGYKVKDMGTHSADSCDYPEIAFVVAKEVAKSEGSVGILLCRTGIGNSIVANKVRGVRAALCYNKKLARLSREHNDANVLVLAADFINKKAVKQIIATWLDTDFLGGRHARRVKQISCIEEKIFRNP